MNKSPTRGESFAERFAARVQELGGWRGQMLVRIRSLIKKADPAIEEEWKWNIPVWRHEGLICTGESYKNHLKVTFAKGASLPDPAQLFNQGGTVRRAIDLREGDSLDEKGFKALLRAAIALNEASQTR